MQIWFAKRCAEVFLANLFYVTWRFQNEKVHSGRKEISFFVRALNDSVQDFTKVILMEGQSACEQSVVEAWSPPPPSGWLKVNTAVAFKDGLAAVAFVVRDSLGNVVMPASSLENVGSAEAAELQAICFAADYVSSLKGNNILWSSDAQFLVKEIISSSEPRGWDTRYLVLQCKWWFTERGWKLEWHPRCTNKVADLLAKETLKARCPYFSVLYESLFPSFLSEVVLSDSVFG